MSPPHWEEWGEGPDLDDEENEQADAVHTRSPSEPPPPAGDEK